MFNLTRLPETHQRNVGNALEAHLAATPKPVYVPAVMKSAAAVIARTAGLGESGGPTLFVVDRKTDTVIACILRTVQGYQKAFSNPVVPLSPEQQAWVEAADLVQETWFPDGLGFIHASASEQNVVMTAMRKALHADQTGPALQQAIQTLGMRPLVDLFISHAHLYAKKLGVAGEVVTGEDVEPADPSDRWHEAYLQFAIDVSSAYRDDPATRETLLGSYERQLAEYRADQAKDRKKEKAAEEKAKADAEAKAKADAEAKAKADAEAKAKGKPEA